MQKCEINTLLRYIKNNSYQFFTYIHFELSIVQEEVIIG
jgi:hypothetical protein